MSARLVWDIHHLYEPHVSGAAFEARSLFKAAYSTTTVRIKTALALMGFGCAANSQTKELSLAWPMFQREAPRWKTPAQIKFHGSCRPQCARAIGANTLGGLQRKALLILFTLMFFCQRPSADEPSATSHRSVANKPLFQAVAFHCHGVARLKGRQKALQDSLQSNGFINLKIKTFRKGKKGRMQLLSNMNGQNKYAEK